MHAAVAEHDFLDTRNHEHPLTTPGWFSKSSEHATKATSLCTCVEIKILRRVRVDLHMATMLDGVVRFLTARRSQHGRVIAAK